MRKWLFDEFCVYMCVCTRSHTGSFPRAVLFCSSPRWCRLPWQLHQLWISPSSSSSPSSLCPFLCAPISLFLSLVWFSLFLFSLFLPLSAASIKRHSKQATSHHLRGTVGPRPGSPISGREIYGNYRNVTHIATMLSGKSSMNMGWITISPIFLWLSFCYITVQ